MRRAGLCVAMLTLCFASTQVYAQSPATQPGDVRLRFRDLERDDQKSVNDWMNAKMPNLAKLIASQPENTRPFKRNRLLNAAAARWRTYQQAKDSSVALEAVMRSVRLEDEIFGYINQLEDAPNERRAELRDKIQTRTRALVDLFLADRAERINRLRARLDSEQKTLDADRAHANTLVEQRLAHFMVESTTQPSDGADAPGSTQ